MSSTLSAQASAYLRDDLPDSTRACSVPAMPRRALDASRTTPDLSRRR
jgi:hypothetical protein